MKIEITKTETIKPSSPTASHLKSYKLSLLDQLAPAVYCRMLFFYPKNDEANSDEQISQKLKESLSESLALFYPIAGRLINNTIIDCNDQGAQYIEARFSGLLSTFLDQPADPAILGQFVPTEIESPESATWPLLLVQATFFDCGGLALGACMSHKLVDGATMGVFMKSWAASSNGSGQTIAPVLTGASYFPQRDLAFQLPPLELKKVECVTKRCVFDKSKIVDLKAKVASDDVPQPTRSEAATAVIWKSVIAAASPKKIVLTRTMNVRNRAEPPLPENLVGNVVAIVAAETTERKPELSHLVTELRKGIREFSEDKAKNLRGDVFQGIKEAGELIGRDNTTDGLFLTSFCNFDLYTVDFGWGKPIWVTIPVATHQPNVVTLIDTSGGGVEAWVTLSKPEMVTFSRMLLEFSSI
ncbi:Transferase [Parasponia andersonii]|uniref:Transferase n=1 Tax=Parasponia andersonii TaxID=3476 RepID=A0A2P5BFZ7_PARAD|nr:Transferase [Parasponia andersonii]